MSKELDTSQTATSDSQEVSEDAVVSEATLTTSNEEGVVKEVYELGFHLLPHLDGDAVAKAVTEVRNLIEDKGGRILAEGYPELIDLAYAIELKKPSGKEVYDTAHFGWMMFELETANIIAVTDACKQHEDILRFLVVKADPNFIYTPKPKVAKKEVSDSDGDEEEKPEEKAHEPISEEELDRSIDELVEEK